MSGVDRKFTIGRAPGNDFRLDDPSVSAQHAVLEFDRGRLVITDRRSSNGTYLVRPDGSQKAVTSQLVTGIDRIRFGKVELLVQSILDAIHAAALPEPSDARRRSGSDAGPDDERGRRVRGKGLVRAECGHVVKSGGRCGVCAG